jgi:hypothetical protein
MATTRQIIQQNPSLIFSFGEILYLHSIKNTNDIELLFEYLETNNHQNLP